MSKIRVVFMGSRDLGYRTLKWLLEDGRFEVVGVCLYPINKSRHWKTDPRELVEEYKIPELLEEEIKNICFDLGLSVNYHRIIDEDTLTCAPKGFWNIHHSYNLRLKGRHMTTHAILRSKKDKIFYHGTSLHKMDVKLDSGPIVASEATPIYHADTAYSLFLRVNDVAYKMFTEWIPRIAFETVYPYLPSNEGTLVFKSTDLPSRQILLSSREDEIYDKVRAFDFPGMEPAYIILEGKKINVVINRRDQYQKEIIISNQTFYND